MFCLKFVYKFRSNLGRPHLGRLSLESSLKAVNYFCKLSILNSCGSPGYASGESKNNAKRIHNTLQERFPGYQVHGCYFQAHSCLKQKSSKLK